MAATGTTAKKAPRQPTPAQEAAQRRRDHGRQRIAAVDDGQRARHLVSGTRRIAVAADIDQKPPIATPMKARPIMKTV
jgi:hypothetical protein